MGEVAWVIGRHTSQRGGQELLTQPDAYGALNANVCYAIVEMGLFIADILRC